MQIRVSNALFVTDPSLELVAWCKKNLVLPNPEYVKKLRMGFYVGDTPKQLSLYEKRGSVIVLPFGVLRSLPQSIVENAVFVSDFKPSERVDFKASIPLYDYQEKAVQAMLDSHYGILQSAAGSGKTQMGIALAARVGKRTLWLCHTLDLIKQSKDRAELYMDKDLIGTIAKGKVDIGKGITFATVQTMCNLDLTQYKDYWDCIIVDECHRVSGTPTTITQYQKVLNNLSARHKYGLSATVHRSDSMIAATYALLGTVMYNVPDIATADRVMKVGICPVGTGVPIGRAALNSDGTVNYAKLMTYLSEHRERNELIVSMIERKSSLILSNRLGHLETLMNLLPADMKKDAVMITGSMTTKKGEAERAQAIEDMRSGRKKYLFATYALCKEGLDIPRLERLYMALPVKDYAVVVQSIGRIARVFDGKSNPIAYDFVDNSISLMKSYQQRLRHYKKAGAYICDEPTE